MAAYIRFRRQPEMRNSKLGNRDILPDLGIG